MKRSKKIYIAKCATVLAVPVILWAYGGGPDPRKTGAPGDGLCTECHIGSPNPSGGQVEVVFPGGLTYTPGVTQRLTVRITDASARVYGFQLTARLASDESNGQAGDLNPVDASTFVLCDNSRPKPCPTASTVQFIEHNAPRSTNTFSFDWTPPATDVGNVRIFVAGNAANGNTTESGDRIYTANYTLTPAASGPSNTQTVSLGAGGSQAVYTLGESTTTRGGSATVTVNSGEAPYGIAVFKVTAGGVIVSEAGVPATPPSPRTRIFIDYRTAVASASNQYQGVVDFNTGVGMVNPSSTTANIQFTLRNTAGQTIASGRGTLAAGAHTARTINDLRSIAPDFMLPPDFPTAIRFGTLDVESDQPLSVMALRVTINQRNDLILSTTPVTDLTAAPSNGPIYFAHLPEGGGFTTALFLVSTSTSTQTGRIDFLDDNGAPFPVRPVGGQSGTSFEYSVPSGGSFILETDGSRATVGSGWARLTPTSGQTAPAGAGSFRNAQGGIVTTESGIATATPTTLARIYVDTAGGYNIGLALANPGAQVQATLRAYQRDGVTPAGSGPATVTLPASGHLARVAGDFISGLPAGFTGVLEVSTPEPIVALTVRSLTNNRGDLLFTTFPVADLRRPAPTPVIIPHIADGGGFQTELILIEPGAASSLTVRYFGDDGQPLNVAKP